MSSYRLSQDADDDLLEISRYTVQKWGGAQALRYVGQLEAKCRQLASAPSVGRTCNKIRPGLRRMEQGSHVIFYRQHPGGILVVRILHQRMLPVAQHFDNDG